jgi:hypothetical protein
MRVINDFFCATQQEVGPSQPSAFLQLEDVVVVVQRSCMRLVCAAWLRIFMCVLDQ